MLEPTPPLGTGPHATNGLAAPVTSSARAYRASQTFLLRSPNPNVIRLRIASVVSVLLLFYVLVPLLALWGVVPDYKVNFLGKYLCYAIAALGVDLIWGYTGLLSLCQALFFCMGGYIMAMHLSLPQGGGDVRPEYNNIPQFMFFNNVHELPIFWKPFASMSFTLIAGFVLPAIAATLFGFFILRSRVRGVYFSIITQALAWASWLLISRNEMLMGGTNGLTNFYKPLSQDRHWIIGLYLTTLTVLLLGYLLCLAIVKSRLGRVLVAVRDKETRLYFAGYKPYAFKVFAFAVGAVLAAVGGMLYPVQTGIITPQNLHVEASIFIVLGVALGGRGKLWGAVYGELLVFILASALSSDLQAGWLLVEGLLFVGVVLFLPDGFVGIWQDLERKITRAAGFESYIATATPLVVMAIFALAETLGLIPPFLRKTIFMPGVGPLQWKYIVLILIVGGAAIWSTILSRNEKIKHLARGFAVDAPSPAPATPAVAGQPAASTGGGRA